MSRRWKRIIADSVWFLFTYGALQVAGAGYWSLIIVPYGLWSYYDGMTRSKITD